MKSLSQDRLLSLLSYDKTSGAFKWISGTRENLIAGTIGKAGYIQIKVDGKIFLAHRLAFLAVNGAIPSDEIDHVNGERDDNRWSNLRAVSRRMNAENLRASHRDNKTGHLGVSWSKDHKKFHARIRSGSKQIHLGYFDSSEVAHQKYLSAKRELHSGGVI